MLLTIYPFEKELVTFEAHVVEGGLDDELWGVARPGGTDELVLDAGVQLVQDGDRVLAYGVKGGSWLD